MQLPQDLQHFPHLALIVVADHQSAKLYLAGGESLEELDGLSMAAGPGPDHEHSFVPSAHDGEGDRLDKYAALLAEHVAGMVEAHEISHVHLVMPADLEHLVSAALPGDVSAKVMKRVHADLMNEAPLDVVRRLTV